LGIIIGIGAIIALISVSQGLENAITAQFDKIGSTRIYVMPKEMQMGSFGVVPFTNRDVDLVKKAVGVEWVNPYLMITGEGSYGNEKKFLEFLRAGEPSSLKKSFEAFDFDLLKGRYIVNSDKYTAMIGYRVAKDLFKKEMDVNNRLEIKGKKFKIVGIFEPIGTEDDDFSIFIPMDTARELFDKKNEISMIEAKVGEGVDVNMVAKRIERRLKKYRGEEDFFVMTPEQLLKQVGQILSIIKVVLAGIAAISLLVGAVGIMNSMYTNVLERTREIGIMKSVGATNNNIMMIFLMESGMVGLIGGVLGVVGGMGLSFLIGEVAKGLGFQLLKIEIDIWLVVFALVFAFVVGALSGYLPARQAAKLKPVEALNY